MKISAKDLYWDRYKQYNTIVKSLKTETIQFFHAINLNEMGP